MVRSNRCTCNWYSFNLSGYFFEILVALDKVDKLEQKVNLLRELIQVQSDKIASLKELIDIADKEKGIINQKLQLIYHDQSVMFDELKELILKMGKEEE